MYRLKKHTILFILFALAITIDVNAQCAMCRAVLESEQGQHTAKGINDGIIYLMAIPYLLVGGISFMIYKKFNKSKNTID